MPMPTVNMGSANEVGRAQLKPIPASQDTSTMRLPGENAASSGSVMNISGAPVSWSTQLTTMSNPAREAASGRRPSSPTAWHRAGAPGPGSKCTRRRRGNGGAGGDIGGREQVDTGHAECLQRSHRAGACRAEADNTGPKRAAILTGDPHELHGVQHRAVAGQFVVLVEHVHVERAVLRPMVH